MTAFQPVRLGEYLLLNRIARGGMAELYKAKILGEQGFEKLVAVKKILSHLTGEKDLIASFIDEAKLAAFLQHENIVQIYDFGSIGGDYVIVMEYLPGKNLQTILAKSKENDSPLSLENILYVTSRICDGLDYSHKLKDFQGKPLNIIHRDISPPNILITYEGQVKIVDFGIAKASSHSRATQANVLKGKVAFMSPEQADGKNIDQRSDIFSTGILLYEMVTHKRMYEGEHMLVLSKARKGEFEPPENLVKDLPPLLSEIMHKALAKEPANRYQSCGEMLSDLEQCLYQLSMRPTARDLAQYMKELFGEQAAAEKHASQETSQVGFEDTVGIDHNNVHMKAPYEKTVPIHRGQASQEHRKKEPRQLVAEIMRTALDKFLILCAIIWTFIHFMIRLFKKRTPAKEASSAKTLKTGIHVLMEQILLNPEKKSLWRDATLVTILTIFAIFFSIFTQQDPIIHELQKGVGALETKRFAEAVTLFEKITASNPSIMDKVSAPFSRSLLGRAAEISDTDPEKAEALVLKSLDLEGDSLQGYFQLGLVYFKQKEYANAIAAYQKAVQLDPLFPDTFFNLGYVYALVEDYPNSEKMYSRVVELAPSFIDEALFNLAMIQERLGKIDQSLINLQRAVKINPENEMAKTNLDRIRTQEKKR